MKTVVIQQRVADFLGRYAPFDSLSAEDLLQLAGSGRVKFHTSEEYVLRQGDAKAQFLWVVQQGRVDLIEETHAGEQLRDVVSEGDVLGLDQFAGDGSCLYSARTCTDVILYGISAPLFESLIARYPTVKRFVAAHFSVAGVFGFGRSSWLDAECPPSEFFAARSRDRQQVQASIPSPPATRPAIREMIRAGVSELRITGSSSPVAILTADDLALFCGHNPARLLSSIRNASSAAELVPLLRRATQAVSDALAQPNDVDDCCRISGAVADALSSACIRLAHRDVQASGIEIPELPSCWLMFGGAPHVDLLGRALPTIAAVYDDTSQGFDPRNSTYFAALAGETAEWFYRCGLDGNSRTWPDGSQPCMPLSEWRRFFTAMIRNPVAHDLYACREFFDIQAISGDRAIRQNLQAAIVTELDRNEMVIALLANDTLANLPPLAFFRGLVLGLDGGQQESLDLNTAALSPITGAARVFALAKRRLDSASPIQRLRDAANDFPAGANVFRNAAEAFSIALYYQTLAGGSDIMPSWLGKFDQRLLKTAFSSVQRLLEFTTATFLEGK